MTTSQSLAAADTFSAAALPPGSSVELANGTTATTGTPGGVALSPNGSLAYVTNSGAGTVSVINTATGATVGSPITVQTNPTAAVLNSAGTRLYVANRGSNTVSVVNTTNNTVIKNIAVGASPDHLALSPDGTRLLVSNSGAGTVTKINTNNNTIAVTGIKVGTNPGGIAYSPDGKYAYVANTGSDSVSIITMSTNQAKTLTGVGDSPTNITVNPATGTGYVTTLDGKVTLLNTTTNTIAGTIITNKNATAAALSPNGDILITANTDDTVTAINTATGSVITTLQTDSTPAPGTPNIAYHPAGGAVFVTDAADNALRKVSVTVTTTPNNPPELVEVQQQAPDHDSGTATGTVVATDDDAGDTLTYAVSGVPAGATVTIDSATGQYSYTPSTARRLAAGTTPSDVFTVTVSDGRDSIDVPVSVPVSPMELANTTSTGTGNPAGVVLDPTGARAYVTNRAAGTVSVINTSNGNTIGSPITVGNEPTGIAINAAGTRLYVANRGSNTVSVINTTTNAVIKTITVGTNPEHLALSPDGTRLLVSNTGNGTVTKINTGTNQITTSGIKVGTNPAGIAFSPDGKYAYVANTGSDTVSVITMANNAVKTLTGVGDGPTNIVVNTATGRGYVTTLDGRVALLNTATNTITGLINTGKNSTAAALSPDGKILITANTDDTITAIDTTTNTVVTTVQTDPVPESGTPAVAFLPGGQGLFVTDGPDNLLRKILLRATNQAPVADPGAPPPITNVNTTTGVVSGTVTADDPDGDTVTFSGSGITSKGSVVVNPDGTFTYTPTDKARTDALATSGPDTDSFVVTATDGHGGSTPITVSDVPVTPSSVASVPIATAASPQWVAFSPDGSLAYVANQGNGTVSIVNTTTKATVGTLNTGSLPTYAATAANGKVYVTNQGSGTVTVIDPSNNNSTSTINVGGAPIGISFANGRGYVATSSGGSVVVFDTTTNAIVDTFTDGTGGNPVHAVVSPSTNKLYVTNQYQSPGTATGTVTVIDLVSHDVDAVIPMGFYPTLIQFNSDGTRAYVTQEFNNVVSVVDTDLNSAGYNTVIQDIPVGTTPIGLQVKGDRAYVVNFSGLNAGQNNPGSVTVIDLNTNTVIGNPIPVGNGPVSATVSPNGKELWVVNQSGSISVIPV